MNYITLDILKGIGLLMIILVHNRHFVLQGDLGLWNLVNFGQMGCQIFFVASGFGLMAGRQKKKKKYDQYILGRYKRILPGFAIALAVNLLLNIVLIQGLGVTPGYVMNRDVKGLIANLTLMHGLFPEYINSVFPAGWYIGTAMILYFLFPVCAWLMEKVYSRIKGGALIVPLISWIFNRILQQLICGITEGELYPYNNTFMYFLFINQLPVFLLGIELYLDVLNGEHLKQPPLLNMIAGLVMIAASAYLFIQPLESSQGYRFTYIPTIMGCGVYCLGLSMFALEKQGMLSINPISLFLMKCGRHSYGMYLIHTLFSWYGLRALTDALNNQGIEYNDKLLFVIVYPLTIALTYYAGCRFDILLDRRKRR